MKVCLLLTHSDLQIYELWGVGLWSCCCRYVHTCVASCSTYGIAVDEEEIMIEDIRYFQEEFGVDGGTFEQLVDVGTVAT